jgi:uncharacterized protein (TIGR02186 family)
MIAPPSRRPAIHALIGLAWAWLVLTAAPSVAQAPASVSPAGCPSIVSEVLDGLIEVDSGFRGARVTVYGAVQSTAGRRQRVGDVVVTLRGPDQPIKVRRKRQSFGAWAPTDQVAFAAAPAYFAVAASRPLNEITSPTMIWTQALDPAPLARLAGPTPSGTDPGAWRSALLRLKRAEGLYVNQPLIVSSQSLFRATFDLPANAPIGRYEASVYLFCGGAMLVAQRGAVAVERTGVERTVHNFATEQPMLHGLLAVVIAVVAGLTSALVYRRI